MRAPAAQQNRPQSIADRPPNPLATEGGTTAQIATQALS